MNRFSLRPFAIVAALIAGCWCFALCATIPAAAAGTKLYLPVLHAAPPETLVEIGQLGGSVGGVVVQGDRAFLAIGPRVIAVDLTDRAHPREVGASPVLDSAVKAIAIEGNHVWAGLDSGALVCLDIAGADGPRVVSILPVDMQRWSSLEPLAVRGTFAYFGTYAGLAIADISDPRAPRLVGGPVAGSAGAYDIALAGDHAYASYYKGDDEPGGIDVYDVADPWTPRLVASLELTYNVFNVEAEGDTVAAIANHDLWLIDVQHPESPKVAAVAGSQTDHQPFQPYFDIGTPIGTDIVLRRGTVWMALPGYGTDDPGGVVAIDVSNIRSPRLVGEIRTFQADRLAIGGDIIVAVESSPVAAQSSPGVEITVIEAEPSAMRLDGTLRMLGDTYDLWLADHVAFVSGYGGYRNPMQVVDLRTPSQPRYLGDIPISTGEVFLVAGGQMLTLGPGAGGPGSGVSLVRWDVTDPIRPRRLGETQMEGYLGACVRVGDWLYFTGHVGSDATYRSGIWQVHAIDAGRPPRFLRLYDAYRTASSPSAIAASGDRIVTASDNRFWVFDVADPDHVREVASFGLRSPAALPRLVAEGNTAFVLRSFFGAHLFDISATPREMTTEPWLPGRWYGLYNGAALRHGRLYVPNSPFEVWDVRAPLAPRQYPMPGGWSWTGDVAVDGELVVVASTDGGLRVLTWH